MTNKFVTGDLAPQLLEMVRAAQVTPEPLTVRQAAERLHTTMTDVRDMAEDLCLNVDVADGAR